MPWRLFFKKWEVPLPSLLSTLRSGPANTRQEHIGNKSDTVKAFLGLNQAGNIGGRFGPTCPKMGLKRADLPARWDLRSVMRITGLVTIGLLMGVSLAGCDQAPAPQQVAQVAAPVAPPCNCGDKAVPDTHLTRLSYIPRHHRHHYSEGGYHGSYTSRSEESVQSYDYVSASSVSYSESSTSSGGY